MSMKMDATSNDRESLTARYTIAANIVFFDAGGRRRCIVLPLEELIRRRTRGALLRHVGFQPIDLVV